MPSATWLAASVVAVVAKVPWPSANELRAATSSPAPAAAAAPRARLRSWEDAEAKADAVLANLTLEEKQGMINGNAWSGRPGEFWKSGHYVGGTAGVGRGGVPPLKMQDSGNGFRATEHFMVGTVTVWPSPLALASTWNDTAVESVAAAIAQEFRAKGANVLLGPAVNVHRVARGGRNFEYLSGEDPYLGARLARSHIRGVHGAGVMAVVKHWAFNEQETERMSSSSEVSDRTAWELYYPPFEAAVQEGAVSFMCGYNRVNGTHCCENSALLQRDLRERMGFRGFVMSDWWATHSTSLGSGLDMNQPGIEAPWEPGSDWFSLKRLAQVGNTLVDGAARRVLTAIFRLGLDLHGKECEPGPECLEVQHGVPPKKRANEALAQQVAGEAVVLLKNDGILPIRGHRVKTLVVVGTAADAPPARWGWQEEEAQGLPGGDVYSGGGSGHLHAGEVVSALRGIQERARRSGVRVIAAAGEKDALAHRAAADAFVVVAGATTVESRDRESLSLDGGADSLIAALAPVKPTVVLMQVPGAVLTPWRGEVAAAACLFYGGEQTGSAWADVLFGDRPPSGKLPITFPAAAGGVIEPGHGSVHYSEGLMTSYRKPNQSAAFAFGHGLSYTTFDYEDASATFRRSTSAAGGSAPHAAGPGAVLADCSSAYACSTVTVRNSGKAAGAEVAQLYAEFLSVPDAPRLQLRGFHKTRTLQPDESEEVVFRLTERDLSVYRTDVRGGSWVPQRSVKLHVGASSADLRLHLRVAAALEGEAADSPLSTTTSTTSTSTGEIFIARVLSNSPGALLGAVPLSWPAAAVLSVLLLAVLGHFCLGRARGGGGGPQSRPAGGTAADGAAYDGLLASPAELVQPQTDGASLASPRSPRRPRSPRSACSPRSPRRPTEPPF